MRALPRWFDVEDDWDRAYIVMEGRPESRLDDLLAAGPLDPSRAAQIVAEASGGALRQLTPRARAPLPRSRIAALDVRRRGQDRPVWAMDAALAGITSDDPALADTRGLARLLYAALTGHWPGTGSEVLPPAPVADGLPRSPRQVRAGSSHGPRRHHLPGAVPAGPPRRRCR